MVGPKHRVNWLAVENGTNMLAQHLMHCGTFDNVLVLARGGMVVGCMLAHALKIRNVSTVSVRSYDDNGNKSSVSFTTIPKLPHGRTIIVDDIADTGASLNQLLTFAGRDPLRRREPRLDSLQVVTLYAKPAGAPLVDYYAFYVQQEVWVEFPWEAELPDVRALYGKGGL